MGQTILSFGQTQELGHPLDQMQIYMEAGLPLEGPYWTLKVSQSPPHRECKQILKLFLTGIIIFDGNNYFAVWDDDRSDPGAFDPAFDIFGTRITPNGIVLDGPTDTGGIAINSRPGPQQHPVVSFDGTKYIVSWEMSYFYDPPVGIYTARVSTDGILIDGPPEIGGILISQPSSYASRLVWPSSFSSGNNFLLTWIDNREVSGEAKDIYGVLIYPISQDASPYYDTFNVSNIDLSKWQDERGEIIGGKLWLENQSAGGWSSTTLKMLTDNITNHFSSQVSISNSSFTIGDSSVAVKVGGIYYNDTYDVSSFYNEWEGNIYADIRLQLTPDGYLYARAVVVRYNNSNGSSKTTLFARAFSQAISFNTEYELSIELRGSSFIFKCNEETINYQISTPIHPSNKLNRGLIAMVYADEGESGYVKGSFDDVCIGKSCSKATFLPAVLLLLL